MLINDLPDECLYIIFNYFNGFETLINCFKVCVRWNDLILQRFKTIKCLTDDTTIDCSQDTIYFEKAHDLKKWKISGLLSNLKILDIKHADWYKSDLEMREGWKVNESSIKGLIYEPSRCKHSMVQVFNRIEMFATHQFDFGLLINLVGAVNENQLKQLYFKSCSIDHFVEGANSGYLRSLERLHIESRSYSYGFFNGPLLNNLKILELCLYSYDGKGPYSGFQFMDNCPNLVSAYHYIKTPNLSTIDERVKNRYLHDLVLEHPKGYSSDNWEAVKKLAIKYPNLKNVAIRGDYGLTDDNIVELLELLNNVVILDFRYSTGITSKSIDHINFNYKKKSNRSIYLYYTLNQRIEEDWPQFSSNCSRISKGFDFMKNCFLRSFDRLPLLMDPVD